MPDHPSPRAVEGVPSNGTRLSYKFQRLREQLRAAILNGELHHRLPGERELGRRYHANAKTINKALCDLSSEGLLVRQIGRGTFVSGNGTNGDSILRARTFLSFTPSDPSPKPGQTDLLSTVGRRLPAAYALDTLTAPSANNEIPLSAWPVSARRETSGVLCVPHDPLSAERGRLSDDLIAECWRRHVPVVVLGAGARSAKLHGVLPDYVDAGFRLSEHLIQLGCGRAVALFGSGAGQEAEQVYVGCQTSGARHRRSIGRVRVTTSAAEGNWANEVTRRTADGDAPVGLICIGGAAFEAAMSDRACTEARSQGRVVMVCILEPGDERAKLVDVTAYEVDVDAMSTWAVRVLTEARPGDRPVEVIVPGMLHVRASSMLHTQGGASSRRAPGAAMRSDPADLPAEVRV
jgi:hypothetical protein